MIAQLYKLSASFWAFIATISMDITDKALLKHEYHVNKYVDLICYEKDMGH